MSLRTELSQKKLVVGPVALIVLAIAGYLIYAPMRAGPETKYYFYDPAQGQLLVSRGDETKGEMMRLAEAHVMSCGSCSDTKSHFIAYIQKQSPQALVRHIGVPGSPVKGMMMSGSVPGDPTRVALVAKPEKDPTWLSSDSDEGKELMSKATQCENGSTAESCTP